MNLDDKSNEELDRMVAEAQGWELMTRTQSGQPLKASIPWRHKTEGFMYWASDYSPSTNDAQAFELMVEFKVDVECYHNELGWEAILWKDDHYTKGQLDTYPRRAICKAVIMANGS